jgi:hypothetical protein
MESLVRTLRISVKSKVSMEEAKALVCYWHEKQYRAQKIHAKFLARARGTVHERNELDGGDDIQGHAAGGGSVRDDRIDRRLPKRLKTPLFIQLVHGRAPP